jgi:hypothetical protein
LNADIDPQTVSLCWGMVREDHLGTGLGKALTEFGSTSLRRNIRVFR